MNTNTPPSPRFIFFQISRTLFFGLIVCVFSLNGVLRHLAGGWPETKASSLLLSLAAIPDSLYDALPGGKYFLLELLARWVILSLAVFVFLLLLNSLRHRTINIFVSGLGGLLLGMFALTWISLLIFLAGIILFCIFWVLALLKWIILGILSFILWPPVLFTLISLIVGAVVIALIAQLRNISLEEILEWLKEIFGKLSIKTLYGVLGVIAAVALVWLVVIPFWREYISPILVLIAAWLNEYVAPIIAWIFAAIGVLIVVILALAAIVAVLYILGQQFSEQLASAYACGRDMHTAFATGFTVGAAAGIALLVCLANDDYRAFINASWASTSPIFTNVDIVWAVYAIMPGSVEALLQSLFAKASLPLFDSALLIVTLFLANCSLLMGLLSGVSVEPLRQLFTFERMPLLAKLIFGLFVGVAVVAADSIASQDS
jgi:hypothetical protein